MFHLIARPYLVLVVAIGALTLLLGLSALAVFLVQVDDGWLPRVLGPFADRRLAVADEDTNAAASVLVTSFSSHDPPYFAEGSFSQGSAVVRGGVYLITVRRAETRIKSAIDVRRSDYSVATRVTVSGNAADSYAGIMVRALDNDGRYGVSFEVAPGGAWRVTSDGLFGDVEVIQPWTTSASASPAGPTSISAKVLGRSVSFLRDGHLVFSYNEVQSVGSYVALLAGTLENASSVSARFDYLRCTEPDWQ